MKIASEPKTGEIIKALSLFFGIVVSASKVLQILMNRATETDQLTKINHISTKITE